jgi:hypothetical protein
VEQQDQLILAARADQAVLNIAGGHLQQRGGVLLAVGGRGGGVKQPGDGAAPVKDRRADARDSRVGTQVVFLPIDVRGPAGLERDTEGVGAAHHLGPV